MRIAGDKQSRSSRNPFFSAAYHHSQYRMATLFQVVPTDLFNPLAAPGAAVYVEALLRLFAETKRHQQPLSRDLAMNLVAELLLDPDALKITADADDETANDEADVIQSRAAAILRYLSRCGWLRVETQSDFTQAYILPDYSFRLLETLNQIAANEPPPLQGLICAIHDLLQAAVKDGSAHIRLPEAHRQTSYLLNALKELQHNIGRHIEQALRQLQARDVLEQFFTTYRREIVDKAYHQLRTTDHVSRFRPGVIDALKLLGREDQIEEIAERLRASGEAGSIEAAANRALDQLRDIRENFEALDRLLQAIDLRHGQFVDSAVRTVELQLTASSTTSGQLHAVLTHLINTEKGAANRPLPDAYDPLVNLFELTLPGQESLAPPTRAAVPFVPEESAATSLSPDELEEARERTMQQLNRAIGHERVRRYAFELLRDREEMRGNEIHFDGPEDLALLIYLRYYGDGSLGYEVEETVEEDWIERDGVGFRDFVLKRTR